MQNHNRVNKYIYYWVIWSNYGNGWEPESWYDKSDSTYGQVLKDLKEYRFACPKANYTIKESRELNTEYQANINANTSDKKDWFEVEKESQDQTNMDNYGYIPN